MQPAITPGNQSLPQRTGDMLPPMSDNALWSSEYMRDFNERVLEVRVGLAFTPDMQVLLAHTHGF